ncbi:hypothetical protein PHLCEN_2v12326 [Hermanssonia centrifuga]|uniref:MYND-type domain-containing protein n=1 Tax=Hermanssonia centrifuga TaxID=98765 RepID=A0A2R6NHG1_9APHY|nr:hypothetical protein PHLCEN_2v12326 [Hermanssonia centrifuga]
MLVNISDQSATRRLLQCRDMGVSVNDISMKFMRPPEYATDLHEVDFLVRMKVVVEVQQWVQRMRGRHTWVPILYHYEVILGVLSEPVVVSAIFANLRRTDCGQLCQTQHESWLIGLAIANGHSFSTDFNALAKSHAHRFMSLLHYLYSGPGDRQFETRWVRATYATTSSPLDPAFLDHNEHVTSTRRSSPRIYHVDTNNFRPSLTEGELERIDNTIRQSRSWTLPPRSVRNEVKGSNGFPKGVTVPRLFAQKPPDECACCGKVRDEPMRQCSDCKLVRYCSRRCQKGHWRKHKEYCNRAGKVADASGSSLALVPYVSQTAAGGAVVRQQEPPSTKLRRTNKSSSHDVSSSWPVGWIVFLIIVEVVIWLI